MKSLLARFRAQTTPTDEALYRVQTRIGFALDAEAPVEMGVVEVDGAERVMARLQDREGTLAQRRLQRRAMTGGGLALAAALLLTVMWPEPQPVEVAVVLADGGWSEHQATEHVNLSWNGEGGVAGSEQDLRIEWKSGTVDVQVTPKQGIAVAVVTPDATVRVVGTAFSVTRDALGTHVKVRSGVVQVDCEAGAKHRMTVGQYESCLPTSAAGLLARARALQAAEPESALSSAQAGLSVAEEPALRTELGVVIVESAVAAGQPDVALAAAESALREGAGDRAQDLHRAAASLALQAEECVAAMPHLAALPEGELTEADRAWVMRCAR